MSFCDDPIGSSITPRSLGELLIGDPVAVEAERDPGRQVDARDWLAGEVLRGQDNQVGGAAVGVVHERHDVAVVFGGVGTGRHEDGLAGGCVLAEVVRLDAASPEVVFEESVGECLVGEVAAGLEGGPGDFADDRAVAVAVRPADNPVIDAGEFLVSVIEALLGHFPGGRVDDPPVKCQRPLPGEHRDVVGAFVAHQVGHNPAAVVVGVEGVEDPAGVHFEPPDAG